MNFFPTLGKLGKFLIIFDHIFLLQIIFVSCYPISLKFSTITNIHMVYVWSYLFFSFWYFWRKSDVTITGPKFKYHILMHSVAAAERASSHKSKTEKITKISWFSKEISFERGGGVSFVEGCIYAMFSNKTAGILKLKQFISWLNKDFGFDLFEFALSAADIRYI